MKHLPRVAAVHDMSGFGKCALTVALPVISACGAEVCPLPTAILSANTQVRGFTFYDYTPHMRSFLDHWQSIDLKIDALYSGFLGSVEQIDIVAECKSRFNPELVIIDPVMADNGMIYRTYTPQMCEGMKTLAGIADVLTPNYTEACVLTEEKYDPANVSPNDIERIAKKIAELGAKQVVITGIERENILYNCVYNGKRYYERSVALLPYRMHGTGDLFASLLTGALLTGHGLVEALDSAAAFVAYTMKKSLDYEDHARRGVCFEPYLHLIRDGIFISSI